MRIKLIILSMLLSASLSGQMSKARLLLLSQGEFNLVASDTALVDYFPQFFSFSPDSKRLYLSSGPNVYQYALSTAWDISTAAYDNKSFVTNDIYFYDWRIADDGNSLIAQYTLNETIFQYNLSTQWDASTASTIDNSFEYPFDAFMRFRFSPDGEYIFITGSDDDNFYKRGLSTAWDISTIGAPVDTFDITGYQDFCFSPDGSRLYTLTGSNVSVYNCNPAFSFSTSLIKVVDIGVNAQCIYVGEKFYALGGLVGFDTQIIQYEIEN